MQPRCPNCERVIEPESPHRPFCSERCQLIDLGGWLDGAYVIPGAGPPSDELTDTRAQAPEQSGGLPDDQ